MIFGGPNLGRVLPGVRTDGPVGGDGQELRALELQDAARLRKTAVVTDVDADLCRRILAAAGNIKNGERFVTGHVKTVNTQAKQMNFAVRALYPLRRNHCGGIIDLVAVAFEQSYHRSAVEPLRCRRDALGGWAGYRLRNGPGFLFALETI